MARFLDWMKMNQAFMTGLFIGVIVGGLLGSLASYLAGVR